MCCLRIFRLRLRVPVFVLFCRVSWIIERGNLISYCWLRVYAWLRVKIKVKGTGVRIVLWCGLHHETRQCRMCWLRLYAWLRFKIKAKSAGVRSVLRGGWIIERGNLLCAAIHQTQG